MELILGRHKEASEDGLVHVRACYYVGRARTFGGPDFQWDSGPIEIGYESVGLEGALVGVVNDLQAQLGEALQALNEAIAT